MGAIGPGFAYRLGEHTRWEQQLYVNGIMMGAVPEYNWELPMSGEDDEMLRNCSVNPVIAV